MLKEGRGKGRGEHYKPWLQARDVPSKGKTTRLRGWRTGRRRVTLLSQLELNHFYNVEWDPTVVDYREQFPLEMDGPGGTLDIAKSLGYRHPAKGSVPIRMTTDLLLTHADNTESARAVKPLVAVTAGLGSARKAARVMQKLELEAAYWKVRDVPWLLITERAIDLTLAANVQTVHKHYWLEDWPETAAVVDQVNDWLSPHVQAMKRPLRELALECDLALGLPPGHSQVVAYHLIARRRWPVNFAVPYRLGMVLTLL